VVKGAALYQASAWKALSNVNLVTVDTEELLTNVTPVGLGVLATDSTTKKSFNHILIPRFTKYPLKEPATWDCVPNGDYDSSVTFRITQGDSDSPDQVLVVEKFRITVDPTLPRHRNHMKVEMLLDKSGRLTVWAQAINYPKKKCIVLVSGCTHNLSTTYHYTAREIDNSRSEENCWR
jgi:molecular chaperone DnaK (HSP70)